MSLIRVVPFDMRHEALSMLTRMAYSGNDVFYGDMHAAAAYYVRKFAVDEELFAGLLDAYEYVRDGAGIPENELKLLFGEQKSMMSIAEIVETAQGYMQDAPALDLPTRIRTFAMLCDEEADEPPDLAADMSSIADLVEAVGKSEISDSARWLIIDACINYDAYKARVGTCVEKAMALLEQKRDKLEPYAKRCAKTLAKDIEDGSFLTKLEGYGLKLDTTDMEVVPCISGFAQIGAKSYEVVEKLYGVHHSMRLEYGALVDFFEARSSELGDRMDTLLGDLHSLDDKCRLQVLVALKERPMYAGELAELVGLSPATISHHMAELASKGFVKIEKQGVRIMYSSDRDKIKRLVELIQRKLL